MKDDPTIAHRAGETPIIATLEPNVTYHYCRCGRSQQQPWCDGSHQGSKWTPLSFSVPQKKRCWLCTCKVAAGPYCDGSHAQSCHTATAQNDQA